MQIFCSIGPKVVTPACAVVKDPDYVGVSLLQDVYEAYHSKLLECGATRDEAKQAVAEARKLNASLNAQICPECEGHVTRALDPRQYGTSVLINAQTIVGHTAAWFKYTCATCDFFMSRVESKEKPLKLRV